MKPDCQHEEGTHCIHSSERRSYRNCRRRWDWGFRHHYTPGITAKPLEFGIAFHNGMEAIYEPSRWDTTTDDEKLALAIKVFTETCEQQREAFLKANHITQLEKDKHDDYLERIELGIGMLTFYVKTIHPQADRFYTPVKVEVPFAVELVYPDGIHLPEGKTAGETMTCNSSPMCGQTHPNPAPVTLNGRVDALFEDKVNGGYYIIDWKTAGQLIGDGEHLQLDDQITSYCAALMLVLGIDIRGFLYSEIRKDYPRPPEELKRISGGRKYSINVNQSTTEDIARATFIKYDEGAYRAGKYDEFLSKLRTDPPKYHQRFPVVQGHEKLVNVLKNVAMEAMEMIDPDLPIYPAPSKMNCQNCAFKAPCLGKYNDEDYTYTLESMFGRK